MNLYLNKSPAIPQKIILNTVEVGLLGLSAWLMFGGEGWLSSLLGVTPTTPVPLRRWVILLFSVVTFFRMGFMMFVLMKRSVPWQEVVSVSAAYTLYYLGFAALVLPSNAPLSWVDYAAIALFATGSILNSASEVQRARFKQLPQNKGKLYTEGLFAYSMHINFFGDILWVLAYAIVARNWWGAAIPVFLTAMFAFVNVPALDEYLAGRYGAAFEAYANQTKRLIPFVW